MHKNILAVAILLTAQQSTQENVDLGILNQINGRLSTTHR
jgi:hypothetical protein